MRLRDDPADLAAGDAAASRTSALPATTWEDERLVRECLAGNELAWAALIQKYKRMIYAVPLRYGAQPQDAADIFQQVCVELFAKLADLRKVESLRPWLLTVAAHQSLRWKKGRANSILPLDDGNEDHPPIDIADSAQLAPEKIQQIEMEHTLREAIRNLPPRCSTLIRLLFYGDEALPYAEVARRLGLATGSIGFIRGRCLEKLRKLLDQAGFQ